MIFLQSIGTIIMNSFVRFPVELLIAEVPFLFWKQRRKGAGIRFPFALLLYFLSCGCWNTLIQAVIAACGHTFFFNFLLYLGWAILSAIPILLIYDFEPMELLFTVASGYAAEHICFALTLIFLWYSGIDAGTLFGNYLLFHYVTYILWDVILYYGLVKQNRDKDRFRARDFRIAILGFVVMVAAIGLSVNYSYREPSVITCVVCPAYSSLCCILVLCMEYYVLREDRMKEEQQMMEQLLQISDSSQKSSKEAIDIINIKCHDLKHQIRHLAQLEDSGERQAYIQEVQQAVSIYDATYHTGCEPLDYVLREKTLISNEYHVAFSCLVDGALLGFISPADIYALFGNALDNALNRVIQEKEEERIISLHVLQQEDMILVHLENRCSSQPEFEDGLPLTDKADKSAHGFGVRSIRYLAEKYQGQVYMSVHDGKFFLDILFPKQ